MGSYDLDLSSLGTAGDFVDLVMSNLVLSDTTFDQIHTSIAMFIPDENLVNESKAGLFFGIPQ
jgi:hypothetical protein